MGPFIPEAKIREVRERVDMVALVQRHGVELKRSGRSYSGRCPFHADKTPSFVVWPDEKKFKCFGCEAGGDAFSFVQRILGKSFAEAVTDLAKELGIDIEGDVDPSAVERQQVKDATDFAARHFTERLWDPVEGRSARDYLRSRGLEEETIRAFGLGWAPLAWSSLADRYREHGLVGFGEKAGLIAPRQKGEGFYDVFRGRIIIPIRSPEGRTIAFGGRLLEGDDGPKYLNSKENRLYNKSEVLFGVDRARDEIRRRKSAVLTEGYFDCIGLQQAGVKNALALCSTALTAGHLALLGRLEAKELVLLLDGDDAGRRAVERLAGPIIASGAAARVALLPDGEDPDTFARKVGSAAIHELIREAKPLTQHLFHSTLPSGPEASFEEKMAALDRLKPIIAQLPVGLARSALFGSMSRHFAIPAQELEASLRSKAPLQPRPAPKAGGSPAEPPPDPLEAAYAAAILRDRKILSSDKHRAFDELKHLGLRTLVSSIHSGKESGDALYDASEATKGALQRATDMLPSEQNALEQAFGVVCQRIKLRSIEDRLQLLARQAANAPGSSSDLTEESRQLLEERGALLALKRALLTSK